MIGLAFGFLAFVLSICFHLFWGLPSYDLLSWRTDRCIQAIIIGMSLCPAGLVLQTILKNDLAEPFTLGISSTSILGAATAIYLGANFQGAMTGALLGAWIGLFIIIQITKRQSTQATVIVLTGVILGYFSASLITLVSNLGNAETISRIFSFVSGDLGRIPQSTTLILLAVNILCVGVLSYFHRKLDAIELGFHRYNSHPVWRRTFTALLVIVSFQITSAVLIAGIVGFLGLLIPHAVKKISNHGHLHNIILCALFGASAALMSDRIGQSLDRPLNFALVCSLWGAPLFLLLLFRRQRWN